MAETLASSRSYYLVFFALLALTFVTIGLTFLHLGRWHTPIALLIAFSKALIVALFFMHLRHGNRLYWLALGSGLLWLGILMTLTLSDFLTRDWLSY